ncbi:ABC transporter ATP-binding protein [Hyphomicrobium sp. NDB2Meth4]|uniref:ABC transporter ATP-binding protein n=1 Tax=Hyphomicrobium sp. NDB2Meth4 TaxID=1892846 RepID=UPI0009319B54|nr:ABC transporter ATP-binding protein [Hyphomicrobium sp. NDB2Meth4]
MSNDAVLEAENIEMVLGDGARSVQALKGVCLSLVAGEFVLLVGPSGSGKSTLLSIMGCILKPTRGVVRVVGQSTENMDKERLAQLRRQHVGFVFQSYNLFPGLTARQNVEASLAIRGHRAALSRETAENALRSVGLAHRLHSLPGQMSGGEQQRVAIARAVVSNPSIILADEPTAALDSEAGRGVLQELRRLAREQGRAVLAVSHDARAFPFADRIVCMQDGRILSAAAELDPASALPSLAGDNGHA